MPACVRRDSLAARCDGDARSGLMRGIVCPNGAAFSQPWATPRGTAIMGVGRFRPSGPTPRRHPRRTVGPLARRNDLSRLVRTLGVARGWVQDWAFGPPECTCSHAPGKFSWRLHTNPKRQPGWAGAKTLAGASGWYVVGSPARKSCRTRPFAGLAIGPSHPLRSGGRGRGRCQVQGVRCQARRRCCLTMRHERPPGGTFLWEGPRALSAGTRPTKPPRRRDRSGKSRNLGPKSPFGPERR
jgi:hypothetical protein